MMAAGHADVNLTLADIHDRQLPANSMASTGASNFNSCGKQDSYYHRVLKTLKSLPAGHADRGKYTLEQARLRCGDTDPAKTYLRGLADPDLAPNMEV